MRHTHTGTAAITVLRQVGLELSEHRIGIRCVRLTTQAQGEDQVLACDSCAYLELPRYL